MAETPSNPPLSTVQRWMQAVIMHPDGVESGVASPAAQEQAPIKLAELGSIVLPSSRQSSAERLAIYATAYYSRLLECLGEEFPVLKKTLGDETFDAFAFDYLQRYPSQSYTLAELGKNFARYLEETRPPLEETAAASSDPGPTPDWPELLVDLAHMEWTFSVVFDGPGIEGRELLDPAALAALTDDDLATRGLELAPCLKLLALRFPLNDFYSAMRSGETPDLPSSRPTWLAVTRREYIVRRHELSERQFTLLSALASGAPVGAAIEQAADGVEDFDHFAADLGNWFSQWSAAGFFVAIQ